jgi:hypothetical protein
MVVLVDTVTVAEDGAVHYIRVFSYSGDCLDRQCSQGFSRYYQQPQPSVRFSGSLGTMKLMPYFLGKALFT